MAPTKDSATSLSFLHQLLPSFVRRWFTADEGCEEGAMLHVEYDRVSDILLAWYGSPVAADNVEVDRDLFVRLSRTSGRVVGIEVIDCAARFHKAPSAITSAFACQLIGTYGPQAEAIRDKAAKDSELPLFAAPR